MKRIVGSSIALLALGAGNKPTLPNNTGASKFEARATASIQHPIILKAGKTFPGTPFQISPARARRCISGDMPDETKCQLVVIDVE
jgi:hypothetical protein